MLYIAQERAKQPGKVKKVRKNNRLYEKSWIFEKYFFARDFHFCRNIYFPTQIFEMFHQKNQQVNNCPRILGALAIHRTKI